MTTSRETSDSGPGDGPRASSWSRTLRGPRVLMVLSPLLAVVLTLILYRQALQLPFFFDDMIHLRWLDWHSLPSIWTTAEGLGYYRPLTMSVWKLQHLLLGRYEPRALHLFNLLLHALNASLVAVVAWRAFRERGREAYALVTMLLFLTFPFSYQAIPSTSSLSKPLIATLVLVSVVTYWEARRRQNRRWLLPSLLAAFLAPFAYESGVMVVLAIVSVEALGRFRREFDRFSWLPLLYALLVWGVALPLVVLRMPQTGASFRLPSLLSLWQNGVYFMEGLLFPVSPIVTPLHRLFGLDQYLLLTIVVLLGSAALLAFYLWARRMALFLYALSWFVVGLLPLWLVLDFAYVITSPRLLYLGSVGAALLWAGVPLLLWVRLPRRWGARGLAVVAVLAMLAFNVLYVGDKMALAGTMSTPLWQAARAAEHHDKDDSLLYLNVPGWIAPKEPTYRVGTEGLTFIPEYVRVQDFAFVNTGAEPEIRARMFDPAKQDWPAYIGYAGEELDWDQLAAEIRRADAVYLTAYSATGLRFDEAGALEVAGALPGDLHPQVRFGDGLWLADHEAKESGNGLILTLWWSAQQVPEADVTVFLHIYDAAGQLVAQADGYPLAGLFPPRMWSAGELVRDLRHVELPSDLGEGSYVVVVGWYDTATADRLPAVDEGGNPLPHDAAQIFQFSRP